MLDDFRTTQKIAYKIITNSVKKNRFSHAYIIEANDTTKALEFSISFAKYLFCPYNYTNDKKCNKCNQCKMIDENNYLELKIINPDGMTIKKQQLTELQQIFKNKALLGNKKIYIITEADKLNISSANTILKFLEEPEENIVAILVTNNIYNIIPTILSRCQVLSLQKQNDEDNFFYNHENHDKIKKIIDFTYFFEKEKLKTLCKTNTMWLKNFKEKESCLFGLNIMELFYKCILDQKVNIENNNFSEYQEYIIEIKKGNTIQNLCSKISIVNKNKEKLILNANVALLMDKLIIDLERIS